jgi:hypothetical protein
MNLQELQQPLEAEGCNPASYAIGTRGSASDAYCLTHNGTQWQVYYTERGSDQVPIYVTDDEHQACEFFRTYVLSLRHDHCVGFFRSEGSARSLMQKLAELGIMAQHDQIPYGGWSDPRYRVFVTGKDISVARQTLGTLPLRD